MCDIKPYLCTDHIARRPFDDGACLLPDVAGRERGAWGRMSCLNDDVRCVRLSSVVLKAFHLQSSGNGICL